MKTIQLRGKLGKVFGPSHSFDINSPAEGIRALCHLIDGFEQVTLEGEYKIIKTYPVRKSTDTSVDESGLHLSFGRSDGFMIIPVARGSKKKGVGKVILGIALIGLSFAIPGSSLAIGSLSISTATIATYGLTLALSGASSLLTKDPSDRAPTDQNESFLLTATGNLVQQGNPIPIVYGEVYTGSVVASAGLEAEEYISTTSVTETAPLVDEPAENPFGDL